MKNKKYLATNADAHFVPEVPNKKGRDTGNDKADCTKIFSKMNAKMKSNVTPKDLKISDDRDSTVRVSYYLILVGSAVYILGLFLPAYYFDDFSVLTIDALFFGQTYVWMMGFVGVVSIIGLITKRNLLKLIIPNIFACVIEVQSRNMIVLAKGWNFFKIIGPGLGITLFGAVIAFIGAVLYLVVSTHESFEIPAYSGKIQR